MQSNVVAVVLALLTGGVTGKLIDWIVGRRRNKIDALKTALETIGLATHEIAELRQDLAKAHKEISDLRDEVKNLRAELAARGKD